MNEGGRCSFLQEIGLFFLCFFMFGTKSNLLSLVAAVTLYLAFCTTFPHSHAVNALLPPFLFIISMNGIIKKYLIPSNANHKSPL